MNYVVGSAILLALIFLVFAAAIGPQTCLRKMRRPGYVLGIAVAALVTAGDIWAFIYLVGPTLALYEMTALVSR
jgi:Sec-independent protein secretion pathway component TatC